MAFPLLSLFCATLISYAACHSCGENQVYKTCGPSVERNCRNWPHPASPSITSKPSCHAGCFCAEGHVRDEHQQCIKKEKCPKPPKCKKHETFAKTGFNVTTCKDPEPVTIHKPDCYCNAGYVKDGDKDECVRWTDCPCPGPNQIYTDCVPQYPKTCTHRSNSSKHDICVEGWKGCVCKPNHVLNDSMVCIPTAKCPPTPCELKCSKKEETYVKCVNEFHCDMSSKQFDSKCKAGCECKDGYARNAAGKCIKLEKCPCQKHAAFIRGASACPKTCAHLHDGAMRCMGLLQAGCECNPGYVLNTQGDCVLEAQCKDEEIICPHNMHFTSSGLLLTCEMLYTKPYIKEIKGCVCPENMYYNNETKCCVEPEECPNSIQNQKCARVNERLEHKNCQYPGCLKTCLNPNVMFCTQGPCNTGCYCKPGYVQKSYTDKACVTVAECHCPANSTFNKRATYYPVTCENMYYRRASHIVPSSERCECNKGFVLNSENQCVLEENCKPEEIKCNSYLILTLTGGKFQKCGHKKPETVSRGCICPEGQYFDDYRYQCVYPEECTLSQKNIDCAKTDPSKEYRYCQSSSCLATCDQPGPSENCTKDCLEGCFCKNKMLQVSKTNTTCVLPSQCPKTAVTCGENMIYTSKGLLNYCFKKIVMKVTLGCICQPGFLYNEQLKECVKPEECKVSSDEANCFQEDPKKEYRECQSSTCVATCDKPNPTACSKDCRKGCYCKSGLLQVSADNKTCVEPSHCPKEQCSNNLIPAKHGLLYYCCNKKPQIVLNGCVCPPGLFYNEVTKICVKRGHCTMTKEDIKCHKQDHNKVFRACQSSSCVPTCTNPTPKVCTADCNPGCYCKSGLVQISKTNATCVKPSGCPDKKCGPNASLATCSSTCPKSCANMYQGFQCTQICNNIPTCDCNPGYVFNSKRECIPENECKPEDIKCADNMEFSTCHGCEKTCHDRNPSCTKECKRGCFCKKGFVMNQPFGVCIPETDCSKPDPCAANEILSRCKNLCPDTCANMWLKPIPCMMVCKTGCDCQPGWLRNELNKCVKPEDCKPEEFICPANMHYTSKPCKFLRCKKTPTAKELYEEEIVPSGCVCDEGLVYDDEKDVCVEQTMCPNSPQNKECLSNDENSYYSTCPSCPKTCFKKNPVCTALCQPGCGCKDGYILSKDGDGAKCIPEYQCPIIDPPYCPANGTHTTCRNTCPDTCFNMNRNATRICTRICMPGCNCNKGFVKNSKDQCVEIQDCTTEDCQKSDQNSEFSTCGSLCPKTCDNKNPICPLVCKSGCFCKKGFILDQLNGECIPETKCPGSVTEKPCSPHSTHNRCMDMCPKTCENMYSPTPPPCPRYIKCTSGCDCDDGYVKNSRNICVKPEKCNTNEVTCPLNMHFSQKPTKFKTCNGEQLLPVGCVCDSGLVYDNATRSCIDAKLCYNSPQNKGCNKYDSNSHFSLSHTCENVCTDLTSLPSECSMSCVCDKGYVRGPAWKCIPVEQCPVNCGTNSTYRYVNKCGRTCSTYHLRPIILCAASTVVGCDCKDNYVSNKHGKCVLLKDCHLEEIHCLNEQKFEKSNRPQTCKDITTKTSIVKEGCFCVAPKVLDTVGQKCVQPEMCPNSEENQKCKISDKNSVFSLTHNCEKVCTDFHNSGKPGAKCQDQCICKDGYVRGKDWKCIPYQNCPVKCGTNATFSLYVNTCGRTCSTYQLAPYIRCMIIQKAGCDCKSNFVTNAKGQCVLIKDCPPEELGCPLGQKLEECTRPQTCKDLSTTNQPLRKACFCPAPLVLDKTLCIECIEPATCPNSEENKECQMDDSNTEFSLRHKCEISCTDITPSKETTCYSGCICKKGFVRNKNWKCIKINECPVNCGANATYSNTQNLCGRTCSTWRMASYIKCGPPIEEPGCDCHHEFVKNSKGQCVLPRDCKPKELGCLKGQRYEEDTKPQTCQHVLTNNNEYKKGCFCEKHLVYDSFSQQCVKAEKCPYYGESRKCQRIDPHSVYSPCASSTNATCDNPNPGITYDCRQRCICQDGYIYKQTGKWECVPKNSCKIPGN